MGKCSWVSFERGTKTVLTFIFSHVGLCALVVGYSIAGAFLFNRLESKAILIPYNSTEKIESCIEEMFNISERYGMTFEGDLMSWRKELFTRLVFHDKEVVEAAKGGTFDKTTEDLQERWGIINSMFYCVTVITTIGYGHISPSTFYGRLMTIFYSILGIPLMLLCLNNIGDSMATTFRFSYRQMLCCKKEKKDDSAQQLLNPQHQSSQQNHVEQNHKKKKKQNESPNSKHKVRQKQPPPYRPSRKNMLISPPISTTIHRGSDLPPKIPNAPNPTSSGPSSTTNSRTDSSTPSSASYKGYQPRQNQNQFSPNLSPCLQMDVNTILSECAEYTGTPLPGFNAPFTMSPSATNVDYDHVNRHPSITPPPSPPGVIAPSIGGRSNPSSPVFKESPAGVWFSNRDNGDGFLSVPVDGPYSSQSTRPGSPISTDQTSVMSSASRPWMMPESTGSVTWANPLEDDFPIIGENRQKRHAGKTLVVYNTLSGDALKQQTKIQKQIALKRSKHGQLRNDATTVFTDPVSGQPVNGDMMGLNYRPIEFEPNKNDTRVPMTLVLAFVFSYLLLGALLFSSLEHWNFFDSLYFCFITLSTIGFGDLVPGNLGYETREAQIKLVALCLYLLLGLAVLAMSFSLVQEEVVLKCKAFAQYIGLKDDI